MSGIVFQFSIIIGGVVTILVGLVLSDVILGAVAEASTYETTVGRNGALGPSTPLDVYDSCYTVPTASATAPAKVTTTDLKSATVVRAECNLSGFMGSEAVLFLLPIVYYLFIIAIGLGMIGAGSLGVVGRGPTAGAGAR